MNETSRRDWAFALVLALVTVGLRMTHLEDAAHWEDEAFRYDLARGDTTHFFAARRPFEVYVNDPAVTRQLGSTADVLRFIRGESPYPPVYFLGLHALMRLSVFSQQGLGMLNALAAGLLAFSLWWIARRPLPPLAAAGAVVFYLLSAWDLGISMQLKETGLAAALGWASLALLLRALERDGWGTWLLSGALLGLGVESQQQLVYWGPLQVAIVLTAGRPWRRVLPRAMAGWTLGALLALPWLWWAGPAQLEHLRVVNQMFGGTWGGLAELPVRLKAFLGESLVPVGPAALRDSPVPSLLAAIVFVGAVAAVARRKVEGPWRLVAVGGIAWLGALSGAVAAYVILKQNQALWSRYAPLFFPGFGLAFAALAYLGLSRARLSARAASGVVLGLAFAWGFLTCPSPTSPLLLDRYVDWRPVADVLKREAHAGELVVHDPGYGAWCPLVHQLDLATRHVIPGELNDETVRRIVGLGERQPVWVVLSWGRPGVLPQWKAGFEAAGWKLGLGPLTPAPPLFERWQEVLPTRRVLFDAVVVARFDPPAP